MNGQQYDPAALYRREWHGTYLQEAGWAPEPVWTGGKSRPHRDSIPDRPVRSLVATLTELPAQIKISKIFKMYVIDCMDDLQYSDVLYT